MQRAHMQSEIPACLSIEACRQDNVKGRAHGLVDAVQPTYVFGCGFDFLVSTRHQISFAFILCVIPVLLRELYSCVEHGLTSALTSP